MAAAGSTQDELYQQAAATYGAALERLARSYEADAEIRRDLLQEIHIGLWRTIEAFDGRCSLRTWVYRVAHNIATSHVMRQRRHNSRTLVGLEELENMPDQQSAPDVDRREAVERLTALIRQLTPLDRQVILSYLEGMDAVSIAEITGLSPGNVGTKIHRIKAILARRFQEGA